MSIDLKSNMFARIFTCAEIEEYLDDYLDSELPEQSTARFERHLDECEACRVLVSDCQQLIVLAQSIADTPIPQDVSDRLRSALKEKLGRSEPVKLVLVKNGS